MVDDNGCEDSQTKRDLWNRGQYSRVLYDAGYHGFSWKDRQRLFKMVQEYGLEAEMPRRFPRRGTRHE